MLNIATLCQVKPAAGPYKVRRGVRNAFWVCDSLGLGLFDIGVPSRKPGEAEAWANRVADALNAQIRGSHHE